MMGNNGGMFFGGGFMWIFWLILIVLLVMVVRATLPGGGPDNKTGLESPMDILKKRFARGEIDEEEFERRRKELENL